MKLRPLLGFFGFGGDKRTRSSHGSGHREVAQRLIFCLENLIKYGSSTLQQIGATLYGSVNRVSISELSR